MGAAVSQEQLAAHLSRQEALIVQLQAVVDMQGKMLQQQQLASIAGVGAADAAASEASSDPIAPLTADDEIGGLERRARQAEHRHHKNEPVTEYEKSAPNVEWTDPTPDEDKMYMYTKPWFTTMSKPSAFVHGTTDAAPSARLTLDHVYGYRSSGVRNNVFAVDATTILYFAAGVGIVHDLATNTQHFFKGHTDDIVSIAYHPGLKIVATGEQGRMPSIQIWDVKTCQSLAKLAGFHKRAVVALDFSHDGTRIASAGLDDSHHVAVHEWSTGQLVASAKGNERIVAVKTIPATARTTTGAATLEDAAPTMEFVSVGVKHIQFWSLTNSTLQSTPPLTTAQGAAGYNANQTFLSAGSTSAYVLVGSQGGELLVFRDRQLLKVIDAHQEALHSIKGLGSDVAITGGKDGYVAVWNLAKFTRVAIHSANRYEDPSVLRSGSNAIRALDALSLDEIVIGTATSTIYKLNTAKDTMVRVHAAHHGDLTSPAGVGELWAIAVSPKKDLLATGAEDGTLRIWNYSQKKEALRLHFGCGTQCLAWSPDGSTIAVGMQSGTVHIINAETGSLVKSLTRCRRRVQCLRFSPSGKILAAGSADNFIDLLNAQKGYSHLGRLKGFNGVVLKMDFSVDEKHLQATSQAYELLFFDIAACQLAASQRGCRDEKWASQTGILGWDVQGIWPLNSDGAEVSAVARSTNGKLLASAEDSGLIKLFQFPCVGSGLDRSGALQRRPECESAAGHGEHVTDVAWSRDDAYLFSIGGSDLCVFQWKIGRI